MDDGEVLARLDAERRALVRDGEVGQVLPDVTRLGSADGSHHTVIFSSLTPATVDAVIDREIEHHRKLGTRFEWKAYAHDAPPDLVDRLAWHGFIVGPRETVLVYDLSKHATWADGGDVAPVESEEQVAVFRRVAEAVFGKDYSFTAGELLAALRTGSTQHRGYVAHFAGEPAGIGRLYTHPRSAFGGLYGGATLPAYRGRGLYRAVVAARARDAAALGARHLIVDALPTSRPILERLGFRRLTDTWPCEWRP